MTEKQTISANEVGSLEDMLKMDNQHSVTGNELSKRIADAADNAESDVVVEGEPGTKERILFLLKLLINLVENDRLRAAEIEGMTTEQILDLAEQKANDALTEANDLKNTQG